MTRRIEITDIEALERAYPKCVETVKKPVMANIRTLLKVVDNVPGVSVIDTDESGQEPCAVAPPVPNEQPAASESAPKDEKVELPEFLVKGSKNMLA